MRQIFAKTAVLSYMQAVSENPDILPIFVCAVKAKEHSCDIYFAKSGCDGVYDRDPNKVSDIPATFIPSITFAQIAADKLGVIDLEAAELLINTDCHAFIFELTAENIERMLCGNGDALHKTEIQ